MKVLFLTALVFVLTGCPSLVSDVSEVDVTDENLVWVAKTFEGGKQCNPGATYTPPDVKRLLKKAGIMVHDTRVKHYGVCAACEVCPAYAAVHYALIGQGNLEAAQQLGFLQNDPPESL